MNKQPSAKQILGAKIRAAADAWERDQRKPCGGGWLLPPHEVRDIHLSRMFNLTPLEISYFMTYSRSCTHSWSEGACSECPE